MPNMPTNLPTYIYSEVSLNYSQSPKEIRTKYLFVMPAKIMSFSLLPAKKASFWGA